MALSALGAVAAQAAPGSAGAGSPPPVSIPGGDVVNTGSLAQVTFSLVLVILTILAVGWLLRRLSRLAPTASGGLRVLGGISLGARERVVLLQAGDKQLLLGVTPGQLRALHVFDQPVVLDARETPSPAGFAERLAKALQNR